MDIYKSPQTETVVVKKRSPTLAVVFCLLSPFMAMLYVEKLFLALVFLSLEISTTFIAAFIASVITPEIYQVTIAIVVLTRISSLVISLGCINQNKTVFKWAWYSQWYSAVAAYLGVLLVVVSSQLFFYQSFVMPSSSMLPTLEVDSLLIIEKRSYVKAVARGIELPITFDMSGGKLPQRGQIVAFRPPHEERIFIKRVIGLPGDSVVYQDNHLFINDEAADYQFVEEAISVSNFDSCQKALGGENHLVEEKLEGLAYVIRICSRSAPINASGKWTVPEGQYFMMGDNRDNSADSRYWGTVPLERITGVLATVI